MKSTRPLCLVVILALALAWVPVQGAPTSVFLVTNINDSGPGSLRQALIDANANLGPDTIEFDIPGCSPFCTISPSIALPVLTDDATTIDGYTQPGASPANDSATATILVELAGASVTANSGINILSSNNVIRGLAINRFGFHGVAIGFAEAAGNQITGNYLGLDASGTLVHSNGMHGVFITYGAAGNTIGGDSLAERNVISGNTWAGVSFYGANTSGNIVAGNSIGLDKTGAAALGNGLDGVWIYGGAHDNTVEGNIIGGNERFGVYLAAGSGNTVQGNVIGLIPSGMAGNAYHGVLVSNGAHDSLIGGELPGEGNLISGNLVGVVITGTGTVSNTVIGNFIGTDPTGTLGRGNREGGVHIGGGAAYNHIGGDTPGERNIISGNEEYGVLLSDSETMTNTVSGNFIGAQVNGTLGLGNNTGLAVMGAANNTIGGLLPGEGNLVSSNTTDGIVLFNPGASGNLVAGNTIGIDQTGGTALSNGENGIRVSGGADGNIIGPDNLISSNAFSGILLREVSNTRVIGNLIGSDAAGQAALGNADGISINLDATHNIIGGDTRAERNLISGNLGYGVLVDDASAQNNTISGNYIGTDAGGMAALPNGEDGIYLSSGVRFTTIGGDTPRERNVISANGDDGLALDGASDTTVTGNFIGLNASGTGLLGNVDFGVIVRNGAQNNRIGGLEPGESNLISGNSGDGIYIAGSTCSGNVIAGNYIGTDLSGLIDFGNHQDGVELDVGAHNNQVGPGNRIAFNGYSGVFVGTDATLQNTITQNSISSNSGMGIELDPGAHHDIQPPVITSTTHSSGSITVEGTACPGCTVEIFANIADASEGQVYLGSAVADAGGSFLVAIPAVYGVYLTGTATLAADGTSEFSAPFTATVRLLYLPVALK